MPHEDRFTIDNRQIRFAQEYVKDLDPYKAALRAGYNAQSLGAQGVRTIARNLLKKERVLELIREENDRISARNEGLQDRIIDELCNIAFFDIRLLYDGEGKLKKPWEMSKEVASAISSLESEEKSTTYRMDIGDDDVDFAPQMSTVRKVRTNDKLKALELLGKITGIVRPDTKININANGTQPGREPSEHRVIFEDNASLPSPPDQAPFADAEVISAGSNPDLPLQQ
jgi:phage terminase small subunit